METAKRKQFHYKGKTVYEFPNIPNADEYTTISFAQTPILSFKNFPVLPNLVVLILDGTLITNLAHVVPQPKLKKLYLRSTPFSKYAAQEIMCSIMFGPSLQIYNGMEITEESRILSGFMTDNVKPYLQQGWVIISMNPVKLQNTDTLMKKELFSNDDCANKKPNQAQCSPLAKDPNEACTEAFYDALDLTSQWNCIRKPNFPKMVKSKNNGKRKCIDFFVKQKSIAQCRSIVRDNSKSYDSMIEHRSNVPPCVPSPFRNRNVPEEKLKAMEKIKKRKQKGSEYQDEEIANISENVSKFKEQLETGVMLFSPKDKPHTDITFEERKTPLRKVTAPIKIMSLADELALSNKKELLQPVVVEEETQQEDENSTPKTPRQASKPSTPETPRRPLFVPRKTPPEKEIVQEIKVEEPPKQKVVEEEDYDEEIDEDILTSNAQVKFLELYPELADDDEAWDKYVDDYVASYKKKHEERMKKKLSQK